MLITFDDVLSTEAVRQLRARLDAAPWQAGSATAAGSARAVKANQQIDPSSELALELGNVILRVLGRHPGFISAALPEKILAPRFNRYAEGGHYGTHIDAAVMRDERVGHTVRTDLSATLFLSAPDEYEGGELLIETAFGAQAVKLPAGALVLYPASSLHQVTPVTRGARVASFFWIQSLVRDGADRELLFDLDQAIQGLTPALPADDPQLRALGGVYHNLLRRWAQP